MSIKSLDSVTLYDACRSKDASLQSSAYESLWKYLYSRILYLVGEQPNPENVAEDCCQDALIRIHDRLGELREPAAFLGWARMIAINFAKDELKKRNRFSAIEDLEQSIDSADFIEYDRNNEDELPKLINLAPISNLSRRVVIGRYVNDQLDEELAALESIHESRKVLPSHIQVTRSKNIAKLRRWPILMEYLTGSWEKEDKN